MIVETLTGDISRGFGVFMYNDGWFLFVINVVFGRFWCVKELSTRKIISKRTVLLYCVNTLNGVMEKCELCYKPTPVNYRLSGFTISGRVHNARDAQRTKRFKDRLCAYCGVKLNPKDVRP